MQVDDLHLLVGLADTVDTANALLHPHRVPGHVVVDQGSAELEVQALSCGIGAEQDLGLAFLEAPFGGLAV